MCVMPKLMSLPSADLWSSVNQEMDRAERLLQHCQQQIEAERDARTRDRAWVAAEIERQIEASSQLSVGLTELIESMNGDRVDNRSLRWQGLLTQLLIPLDQGLDHLRDLLVWLDQPLDTASSDPNDHRQRQQREQLQQLLTRRQQQVIKLEAEVLDLRRRLFAQASDPTNTPEESENPETNDATRPQGRTPSIFS